jgi:hypothetical protein
MPVFQRRAASIRKTTARMNDNDKEDEEDGETKHMLPSQDLSPHKRKRGRSQKENVTRADKKIRMSPP